MKKNGQNKAVYVLLGVIGVLLLVIALMVGYFVLDRILSHRDKETMKETEEVVETQAESEEKEELTEETTEELDASELLRNYYEDMIGKSEHLIDYNRQYVASYEEVDYDGYSYPTAGYVKNLDGPVACDIRDYDGDGEDELLTVALVKNNKEEGSDNILEWQIYEVWSDEVHLQASMETCQKAIGGFDIQDADYYIKEEGSHVYIAESVTETVCVTADGTNEMLRVLHYDGEALIEDVYQSFSGSDFSDLEDAVAETASKLNGLGFTNSAAKLTTGLELQPEDGMVDIFLVRGMNQEIYNPDNELWTYYDTQDISVLGEVTYYFYHNLEDYYEKNHITGYKKQVDDFSVSQDGKTVNASFERVVFEGNGEVGINWLNNQITQMENDYKSSIDVTDDNLQSIYDELNNLLQSPYDEEWDYQPYSLESIYYNEEGDVSVGYIWNWYMGGVSNTGWQCVNCNIYTRNTYYLEDILGVDWDTAREQVKQALIEQEGFEEEYLDVQDIPYNVPFYFDEDTVTVCFESYSLNQGPGWIQITLPRN